MGTSKASGGQVRKAILTDRHHISEGGILKNIQIEESVRPESRT